MAKVELQLDDIKTPEPVAAGSYLIKVLSCEVQNAKDSETEMLAFQYEIIEDGDYKGRTLRDISVISIDKEKDPDRKKTATSLSYLKEKLEALNFKWDPDGFDPADIKGCKAIASVTIGEYQGREVNNVSRLYKIKGKK